MDDDTIDQAMLPDPQRVSRGFDRASRRFDDGAFVHGRVRDTLLERLDLVRLAPGLIVDAGCGTGLAGPALARRYRRSRVLGVDLSPAMAARARTRPPWWLRRRVGAVCADATRLPLPAQCAELVFSNLMVCWHPAPQRLFAEFGRVLRTGGLLSFATLGPDTLRELREAWRRVDPHAHVNLFLDMHDIGDALLRAGLADPVMDVETLTVGYADVDRLLGDLRTTGAGNVLGGRPRGLMTPRALARLRDAYEPMRGHDGRLPATVEVVYGHAWGTGPRRTVAAEGGTASFPLSALRPRQRG